MKILHIGTWLDDGNSYGGPTTVVRRQCAGLAARGHEVVVACAGQRTFVLDDDGVRYRVFRGIRLPGMGWAGLWSSSLLRFVAREARNVDVVHFHFPRDLTCLAIGVTLARMGVPFVTQTHGMVTHERRWTQVVIDSVVTRRILGSARACFSLSDSERTALEKLGASRVLPLSNPVLVPGSVVGHEGHVRELLFVGRLHTVKNVPAVVQALAILRKNGIDLTLRIVGPDAGALDDIRATIEATGTSDHVSLLGTLTGADLDSVWSSRSLLVLPSFREEEPLTVLEAMANGSPCVVTTRCASIKEMLEAGAVVAIEPTACGIAEVVAGLLSDPMRINRMISQGRKFVEATRSVGAICDNLERSYAVLT